MSALGLCRMLNGTCTFRDLHAIDVCHSMLCLYGSSVFFIRNWKQCNCPSRLLPVDYVALTNVRNELPPHLMFVKSKLDQEKMD